VATHKKRPILYEVFRPEARSGDPALKPRAFRPSREAARPASADERELDLLTTTTFSSTPTPASTRDRRAITISASTLTLMIAGMIVLLFVAFIAGRRYESFHPSTFTPADLTLEDEAGARAQTRLTGEVDSPASGQMPSGSAAPLEVEDPGRRSGQTTADVATQVPPVSLKRGCHYVIVQHFGRKATDAEAAARFLQERGVPCAILRGNDLRVVATEPFLIRQADAAAGRREQRRANQLIEEIKRIGREFKERRQSQGLGTYTLDGAYLLEIK
jgi:hypothetical protein